MKYNVQENKTTQNVYNRKSAGGRESKRLLKVQEQEVKYAHGVEYVLKTDFALKSQ